MLLRDYALMLRRHLLVVLLTLLVGLLGGIYHATTTATTYTATSRSLLSIPDSRTVQEQVQGAQLSGQLLTTFVEVATSREVATQVALDHPEWGSADDIRRHITATAEKSTYLIDVTATAPTATRAAQLSNAAADALAKVIDDLETGRTQPIQSQILDRATVPTSRTTPRTVRDVVFGAGAGILAAIALVLLLEALDGSVRTVAQAEHITGTTVLTSVARNRRGLPVYAAGESAEQGEAIRSLRTAIQYLEAGRMPSTLVVTSPAEGDGKTAVSANLALSMGRAGHRVVVVDTDLRRSGLSRSIGLQESQGLSDVLSGAAELRESVQTWVDNVDVLTAGPRPANPSELLGSERMSSVISDLARDYDLVVMDAPPVLAVTDAVILAAQAEATLLILRYGKSSRGSARQAARKVTSVGGVVAGVVLNATPRAQFDIYDSADREA